MGQNERRTTVLGPLEIPTYDKLPEYMQHIHNKYGIHSLRQCNSGVVEYKWQVGWYAGIYYTNPGGPWYQGENGDLTGHGDKIKVYPTKELAEEAANKLSVLRGCTPEVAPAFVIKHFKNGKPYNIFSKENK